jgi:hypothetical protein
MSNYYCVTIQIEEKDGEFSWDVIQDFSDTENDDMEVLGHGIADSVQEAGEEAIKILRHHFDGSV